MRYSHDLNGNMISMDDGKSYNFNYRDNIESIDLGSNRAYYIYDSSGNRVRKVIEDSRGDKLKERVYLGGFEIYKEFGRGSVEKQRNSLHIMDDKQRIALVETLIMENGSIPINPTNVIRYQYSDHLQSASVELDEVGNLISYEEYYPYGTTSYHSTTSISEVSQKRYRFNGKEKDTETGLYYYGARYYAPWICRWISTDPIGAEGSGLNMYWFNSSNPISRVDLDGMSDIKIHGVENVIHVGSTESYINENSDGSISYGFIESSPIYDDNGNITGYNRNSIFIDDIRNLLLDNETGVELNNSDYVMVEGFPRKAYGDPYILPDPPTVDTASDSPYSSYLDGIQLGLVGLVPGLGEPADIFKCRNFARKGKIWRCCS